MGACRLITGTGDLVIEATTGGGGAGDMASDSGAGASASNTASGAGGQSTTASVTATGASTTSSSTSASTGSLDPNLAVPPLGGTPCTIPGSENECPNIEVCRFETPTSGICESCCPCGNLHAFCTKSSECDILFDCYFNECVAFCHLGSLECGAGQCVDVGYTTQMIGICPPM